VPFNLHTRLIRHSGCKQLAAGHIGPDWWTLMEPTSCKHTYVEHVCMCLRAGQSALLLQRGTPAPDKQLHSSAACSSAGLSTQPSCHCSNWSHPRPFRRRCIYKLCCVGRSLQSVACLHAQQPKIPGRDSCTTRISGSAALAPHAAARCAAWQQGAGKTAHAPRPKGHKDSA